MNLYREMTEAKANIVKGLCMVGAFDLAKEFVDFIIEKHDSEDQASVLKILVQQSSDETGEET